MIFNFRNWVLQTFPFLEDDFDALTDYELFCKMMEYVKKFAKDNEDFNKRLTDLENYINNLDLQDEVNTKLDEMAEDGTLENLIGQYIELMTTYTYNNVDELKQATNLVDGSFARTSGFYSYNDGGGTYYKIRKVTNDDVVDEMFIIALSNENLIAELITGEQINIKQLGAISDDATKSLLNTTIIQSILERNIIAVIPKGNYYVNSINMNGWNKILGTNYRQCSLIYNGEDNKAIINIVNYGNHIEKISLKCDSELTNINGVEFGENNPAETIIKECYIKVSGDGIRGGFKGHLNNVYISDCFIEECTNGINLQFYNYNQINAIQIKRNIINECSNAGILFYGNNVIVENNTLQENKYGVLLGENGINPSVYKEQDCENSSIVNNYFEGNTDNPIYMNVGYNTGDDYRLIKNLVINNNFFHYSEKEIYLNGINRNYNFSVTCNKIIKANNENFLKGSIIGTEIKSNNEELSSLPYNTISNNNLKYYEDSQLMVTPLYNSDTDYANYPTGTQTRIIIYSKLSKDKINNLQVLIGQSIVDLYINGYKDFGNSARFSFESKLIGTGARQYGTNSEIKTYNSPVISPIVYFENNNKLSVESNEVNCGFQLIARNIELSNYNYFVNIIANKLIQKGFVVLRMIENSYSETSDITSINPSYIGEIMYDTSSNKWYYGNTLTTWVECAQ